MLFDLGLYSVGEFLLQPKAIKEYPLLIKTAIKTIDFIQQLLKPTNFLLILIFWQLILLTYKVMDICKHLIPDYLLSDNK